MKILVLGGGELGVQVCRLAAAAGIQTIVMDRRANCPASASAGEFLCADPADAAARPAADYIVPATDDDAVMQSLAGENVLHDAAAWAVASSRFASDEFLRAQGIAIPEYFPDGSEPYITKPDRGSFGQGVWVTEDFCEVGGAVNSGYVAQEELAGDVWSQAVLRRGGSTKVYPAAKLTRGDRYIRTAAACEAAPDADSLRAAAQKIAEALDLNGILEIEAIYNRGCWKVVDLNARIPMLTPDAVLAAGAGNMLADLCEK